jgi:hypothetical protein
MLLKSFLGKLLTPEAIISTLPLYLQLLLLLAPLTLFALSMVLLLRAASALDVVVTS